MNHTLNGICLLSLLVMFSCTADQQSSDDYPTPPQTPAWAHNATIYEVNIRQYTQDGTFQAFSEHLPRLKEMGVDILWLMPIHPIGEEERKGTLGSYYSVKDYYGINPEFGTEEDFAQLVEDIHDNDMHIILDWVANHTAWDAVWTETHPHIYVTDDGGNFIIPPGTDWTDTIQLDYELTETREMMHDALLYWVEEFNIDGYRCDVADLVPTDFWNETRSRLEAVKPVFMLAEAETPEHHLHAFDMSYAWETHHRMNEIADGEITLNEFEEHLVENQDQFPEHAYRMQFTSNHDENSWNGTVFDRYGDGAETFAVLAATIPGMPLVYSGQEAAMDKQLDFFEKDPIDWGDYPLQDFYTRLLHLNRDNEALFNGLHGGDMERINTSADDQIFAFYRQKGDNTVITLLNLSAEPVTFDVPLEVSAGDYTELFSEEQTRLATQESWSFNPWEYRVYHN